MSTPRTPAPGDPFALTDEPTPVAIAAGIAAPVRAHIHPALHYQKPFEAELVARVGNGKVQVRLKAGTIFAVTRSRLFECDKPLNAGRRHIAEAVIDALPWKGAGPDPLTQPRATTSPPWRVLP